MIFFNLLRVDLKRMILSSWFLIGSIGLAFMIAFSFWEDILRSPSDVIYFLYHGANSNLSILYLVLCALPTSMRFCEDYQSKFYRTSIIRSNFRDYFCSKVVSNIITSILCYGFGIFLFIFALRFKTPILSTSMTEMSSLKLFGEYFANGNWIFYVTILIITKGLCVSLFSIISLLISTYINNIFVAMFTPMIAYYFTVNLITTVNVPYFFMIQTIQSARLFMINNIFSIVYMIIFFLPLIFLTSILFYKNGKKRFLND